MINEFQDKYRFLSNFWLVSLEFEGATYPSVEHAYQAAKTINMELREPFWKEYMTPGKAKRLARTLTLRGDWEDIKVDIIRQLVEQKFQIPHLKEKLLATCNQELVEGNRWHDNFWGNCLCSNCQNIRGRNHLGKILMEIRDELKCQ